MKKYIKLSFLSVAMSLTIHVYPCNADTRAGEVAKLKLDYTKVNPYAAAWIKAYYKVFDLTQNGVIAVAFSSPAAIAPTAVTFTFPDNTKISLTGKEVADVTTALGLTPNWKTPDVNMYFVAIYAALSKRYKQQTANDLKDFDAHDEGKSVGKSAIVLGHYLGLDGYYNKAKSIAKLRNQSTSSDNQSFNTALIYEDSIGSYVAYVYNGTMYDKDGSRDWKAQSAQSVTYILYSSKKAAQYDSDKELNVPSTAQQQKGGAGSSGTKSSTGVKADSGTKSRH